jgi:hypothetical protein
MSASRSRGLTAALLLLALGCGDPAQYRFGVNLSGLVFAPVSATEGIYPDTSVLRDARNPFLTYPLGPNTKWDLLNGGPSGVPVSPVATFYAFATTLAGVPIGENQYYVGEALRDIYLAGAIDPSATRVPLTLPDGGSVVKQMAIDAYQATLDNFPDGRVYTDATATTYFLTATPSYLAIHHLGGTVKGDWILVTPIINPDDGGVGPPIAVHGVETPAPRDGGN